MLFLLASAHAVDAVPPTPPDPVVVAQVADPDVLTRVTSWQLDVGSPTLNFSSRDESAGLRAVVDGSVSATLDVARRDRDHATHEHSLHLGVVEYWCGA
jgi:hypothetical protein